MEYKKKKQEKKRKRERQKGGKVKRNPIEHRSTGGRVLSVGLLGWH